MTPLVLVSSLQLWADRGSVLMPLLAFPVFLLACVVARNSSALHRLVESRSFPWVVALLAAVSFALYLGQVWIYLSYPGYVDPTETMVASASYLASRGQEVYPLPETGDLYGSLYGPAVFLINGAVLRLDPSVLGSKLQGVAALLLAIGVTWQVMRLRLADELAALLALATFVVLLLPYGQYAYYNHGDPFLILASALSLAALRLRGFPAAAVIGLLMGFAACLKLHGFIYVTPAAFCLVGREDTARRRLALAAMMAGSAVLAVAAPFMVPNVSLVGYLRYLALAGHHGLRLIVFCLNLVFASAFCAPVVWLLVWRRPVLAREDRWLVGGFALAGTVVVIIGSKVGAGPHHLLPLIPVGLYVAAAITARSAEGRPIPLRVRNLWAVALLVALLGNHIGFAQSYGGVSYYALYRSEPAMHEAIDELREMARTYPGAQMGASDDQHFSDVFPAVVLVFEAKQLHLDNAAWLDLATGGVSSSAPIRFLNDCRIPSWILPAEGPPFSLGNHYTGQPLFSDEFRSTFFANYQPAKTGRFYRAWTCRALH